MLIMIKKGCDKVLFEELMNKANKIDELNIKEIVNNTIWKYSINSDNPDIIAHLNKIMKNIVLDDMYKLSEDKWIKKSVVDNIVNKIENAKTYQDLKFLEGQFFARNSVIYSRGDIQTEIRITFIDTTYTASLRDLLISKINKLDGCIAKKDSWCWMYIKSEQIDEREKCKHTCKTKFKIDKINEIFEL